MTIAVDIHPSSSILYMINGPDASTAYSLSGHVSISSSSNDSFFAKARTEKVLLRSLTLTFEGQAELITSETGYSSVRLCRLTRELAPAQALLLSNDSQEGSELSSAWNFMFDLPVPGWLPSSSVYGSDAHGSTGTSYALYAEARFTPLEGGIYSRIWSLSTVCAPFVSKTKDVDAPRTVIDIVRYRTPTIMDELAPSTGFPEAVYLVDGQTKIKKGTESSHVPEDIFANIEVRASVPEYVDMDANNFTLTLRLRVGALSAGQQQRLRLSQFRMLLSQQEIYSRSPSRSYASKFPLPSSQPDTEPLRNTHPTKALYHIGLSSIMPEVLAKGIRASFPLLSQQQQGRYSLPCGGVPLQHAAAQENEEVWVRVDVCVPFEHVSGGQDVDWEQQHGRVKALRADEDSPLFRIRHGLEVELTFAYEAEAHEDVPSVERMVFSIPVKFARLPPKRSRCADESGGCTASSDIPFVLPAYSQLFHPNGERRRYDSVPLPAYTPHADPEDSIQSNADKL